MNECQFLSDCALFKEDMADYYSRLPGVLDYSAEELEKSCRKKYCNDKYRYCARYKVASNLGKEYVPDSLLPSQDDRARQIIAAHKRK